MFCPGVWGLGCEIQESTCFTAWGCAWNPWNSSSTATWFSSDIGLDLWTATYAALEATNGTDSTLNVFTFQRALAAPSIRTGTSHEVTMCWDGVSAAAGFCFGGCGTRYCEAPRAIPSLIGYTSRMQLEAWTDPEGGCPDLWWVQQAPTAQNGSNQVTISESHTSGWTAGGSAGANTKVGGYVKLSGQYSDSTTHSTSISSTVEDLTLETTKNIMRYATSVPVPNSWYRLNVSGFEGWETNNGVTHDPSHLRPVQTDPYDVYGYWQHQTTNPRRSGTFAINTNFAYDAGRAMYALDLNRYLQNTPYQEFAGRVVIGLPCAIPVLDRALNPPAPASTYSVEIKEVDRDQENAYVEIRIKTWNTLTDDFPITYQVALKASDDISPNVLSWEDSWLESESGVRQFTFSYDPAGMMAYVARNQTLVTRLACELIGGSGYYFRVMAQGFGYGEDLYSQATIDSKQISK
jgi:hypothetical protein